MWDVVLGERIGWSVGATDGEGVSSPACLSCYTWQLNFTR